MSVYLQQKSLICISTSNKIGLLLHPVSDAGSVKTSEYQILDTEGRVIKIGFPIPKDATTFTEFSEMMRVNEGEYIEHCKTFTL